MTDEKLKILEMVKDGTISPEEALDLIQAIESSGRSPMSFSSPADDSDTGSDETPEGSEGKPKKKPRYLYIKVDDQESGKKVNIRVPIALAKFAGKFIPKHARHEMHAHGIELDLEGLMDVLEKEGEQNLVEIDDEDGRKVVRIYTQ